MTNKPGHALRNRLRMRAVCLLVCVVLSAGSAFAQSENAKNDAKPTSEEKVSPSDAALDEELLKRLLGPKSDSSKDDNPLEAAIRRMREVQTRINGRDTGRETQALQKRVVDDLDKLIRLAERLQSQSGSSASRSKPQPKQNPANPQDTPGKKKKSPGTKTGDDAKRKQQGKASKSTEKSEKGTAGDVELARRERLVKDVWGHLPPALRQQLLNIYSEKYLPKYDALIRRYFEALAEQSRESR